MATNLTDLKRRKRRPDPLKIKKHSDIMKRQGNRLVVGGSRERTDTGYTVPGYKGKTFETYYETMLAGTSTVTYKHEKKDKTIRVLVGTLFVLTKDEQGEHQQRALAGDEIVLERGVEYRLSTSSQDVDFIVCQSAKYNATLEVVNDSSLISRKVSDHLLQEPTVGQRISQSRPGSNRTRRGSKAKQQLQALKQGRKSHQVIDPPIPGRVGQISEGVSPRPSHGKFGDEDAG